MNQESDNIPEDIILKLKSDFKNQEDFNQAISFIEFVKQDELNVGWIQLSRAIILIANGNLKEIKSIIDSNYYGDPRDVIMQMMSLTENTNYYGQTPFKVSK